MAGLLIGSSNVYRHFSRALDRGLFAGRNLQLVQCTQRAVFDATLLNLEASSLIIVSVLENFIVTVCSGVEEEEIQLFARQQVSALVDSLSDVVQRLPGVNVIIVPPMFRSTPPWFGSFLPDLLSFLGTEITRISSSQLAVCAPFIVVPSMLERDGVHLTQAAGDRFLDHLDTQLGNLLVPVGDNTSVTPPDDRLDQILAAVNRNSAQLDNFRNVSETVSDLSRTTTSFEAFVRRRFKDDDLIFARMKEESDADLNRSREDRVVITGLPRPAGATSTHAEKKLHYTEVISRLVTISCAASDVMPKVIDVYINLRKDRGLPLVEARFDSVKGAQTFRHEGVRLAKALHEDFQTLFFSNSVTQSTRVRIEILRELAKKLCTSSEVAFVQGFVSRPVLQYRVKEGSRSFADGVGRSYTFVDAVAKFGHRLAQKDLGTAYVRAGSTFDGALSQYFVVLVDDYNGQRTRSGANRETLGRRGGLNSRGRGGNLFRQRFGLAPFDRGVKRTVESTDEVTEVASAKRHAEMVVDLTEGSIPVQTDHSANPDPSETSESTDQELF